MDDSKVQALIDQIYDAPGSPEAWNPLLSNLIQAWAAEHCHLVVFDRPGRVRFDYVSTAEGGDDYIKHYAPQDQAVHRLMRGADRVAASENTLLSPDELKTCPVYQEFLPKFGVAHRLMAKSSLGGGLTLITGAIRTARQGAFEGESFKLLGALHPHIERAMRLNVALGHARAATASLEAGLDSLATGFILLGTTGQVLFANRVARRILAKGDGLRLEGAVLTATHPVGRDRLTILLSRLTARAATMMTTSVLLERETGRPLVLRSLPVAASIASVHTSAAAVLLIHDPDSPPEALPPILSAMGLTTSEARLVTALALGRSLAEYAVASGLRSNTVRSTLKSALAKTGTHRQAELVALVLRASGML